MWTQIGFPVGLRGPCFGTADIYTRNQLYFETCEINCVIIPTVSRVIRYSIEKCHLIYLVTGRVTRIVTPLLQ